MDSYWTNNGNVKNIRDAPHYKLLTLSLLTLLTWLTLFTLFILLNLLYTAKKQSCMYILYEKVKTLLEWADALLSKMFEWDGMGC